MNPIGVFYLLLLFVLGSISVGNEPESKSVLQGERWTVAATHHSQPALHIPACLTQCLAPSSAASGEAAWAAKEAKSLIPSGRAHGKLAVPLAWWELYA